jgi:hypothetical protein
LDRGAKVDAYAKLVVYAFDVNTEIVKSSEKFSELPVIDFPINLGTTTVTLRTSGNRIQCYLPLGKVSASSFVADKQGKKTYHPAAKTCRG